MLATSQELYGILTVRNTLFSDSGQYKCTVSNIHGYNSHLLTLTIQGNALMKECYTEMCYYIHVLCSATSSYCVTYIITEA